MRRETTNERGTILVVAIMVLLALAGIALLSVRSTFYEVRSASNHNLSRMGYHVADGGTGGMVAFAYENPQSFVSLAYTGGMKVTAETLGIREAMWDLQARGASALLPWELQTAGRFSIHPRHWTFIPEAPWESFAQSNSGEPMAPSAPFRIPISWPIKKIPVWEKVVMTHGSWPN